MSKLFNTRLHALFITFSLLILHIQGTGHATSNEKIKNIIVLVMENRSFDHMFGWMNKVFKSPINGLKGNECNHRSTTDPNSPKICVSDDAEYVDPDPDHSFFASKQQIFGRNGNTPTMSGFVENAANISEELANTVMKGFKPENLPVYAALAQEFALVDRWFASLPGPTQPNRMYVYTATSHGLIHNDETQLVLGLPQKTIFESVEDEKLDFGIYFDSVPGTLLLRNLRKLKYVTKFHRFSRFKRDAAEGTLPSLSVIEPKYFDLPLFPANDDHPSHDVANGQKFVKGIYESLRASPQWNQSLLIVTYDEHGGFYDHVPPPTGVPSPDGIAAPPPYNFTFDRLGVRVPTLLISPWIKKGTVISKANGPKPNSEFEHSSIPATIKNILNLKSNFLNQRDAWAATFENVVEELASPRTDCPETLPTVKPLRKTEADESRPITEFQKELIQLVSALNGEKLTTIMSINSETESSPMTVKQAANYVDKAVPRFFRANKQAMRKGANGYEILDMSKVRNY